MGGVGVPRVTHRLLAWLYGRLSPMMHEAKKNDRTLGPMAIRPARRPVGDPLPDAGEQQYKNAAT